MLTITGSYDDDQAGALEHYRQHMKNAPPRSREKHYLIIGPWDHAGTRAPQPQFRGLAFGPASLLDFSALHLQWYAWTMQAGAKPEFLQDYVAYYVMGAEKWRYAPSLEAITDHSQTYFLDSKTNAIHLDNPGSLDPQARAASSVPDQYVYDPRDVGGAPLEASIDEDDLTEQRLIRAADGKQLVYESAPMGHDTQISGFFRLSAWLSIDRPDTDFRAVVYEIDAEGRSVQLTSDQMRARYRQSLRESKLVHTSKPQRYDFNRFTFVSRQLARGSRLRLILGPIDSIYAEKNYDGAGAVAEQSMTDAMPVTVGMHHDRRYRSVLYVPFGRPDSATEPAAPAASFPKP